MIEMNTKLSVIWIAVMLTYLLGDVLRLYSGDFMPGNEVGGIQTTQPFWFGAAVYMAIPIVMVVLTQTVDHPINRWANIIVAIIYFGFNIIGLPGYPSAYDKFLIIMGLVFNVLTIGYAWKWVLT